MARTCDQCGGPNAHPVKTSLNQPPSAYVCSGCFNGEGS